MTHVKLTLSCPAALGEQITEYLQSAEWLEAGFTTFSGQGHGGELSQASPREKVRGCVEVLNIVTLLPAANVAPLLDALRARFRNPHMAYWTESVQSLGDFA